MIIPKNMEYEVFVIDVVFVIYEGPETKRII